MSSTLQSFGTFGYIPEHDTENITAKLIAQMLWYYIDGVSIGKTEADFDNKEQFLEYHITFTDNNSSALIWSLFGTFLIPKRFAVSETVNSANVKFSDKFIYDLFS